MIEYFITDSEGYVTKKGRCNPASLTLQSLDDGESLHVGSADADTQRVVDGTLVDLDVPLSSEPRRISAAIRQRRDALLAQTDWTQVADCPLPTELIEQFKTYRQELRDLPDATSGAVTINDVVFPTAPSTS